MREWFEKVEVSVLLAVVYVFQSGETALHSHLLYSFFHGNVWHLLGNIACLFAIRGRFSWGFDYVIAVLISFLPSFTSLPVCGFSCVIFAEIGRRFWRVNRQTLLGKLWLMARCVWPAFVFGALMPKIAVFPHLWALLGGFMAAMVWQQREQVKWELFFVFLWLRKKIYGRI